MTLDHLSQALDLVWEAMQKPNKTPYGGTVRYRGHPLQHAIDVCPTEDEANLIAAAPALLAALKNLVDIVVEREQGNHDLDEELDAGIAAIAIAEGTLDLAKKEQPNG